MPIPSMFDNEIRIKDIYAWMDGGTVSVIFIDKGVEHLIEFTQWVILELINNKPFPGSLYLDYLEVPVRSELERRILNSLKKSILNKKYLPQNLDFLDCLKEAILYTESDQYIDIAKQFGRI